MKNVEDIKINEDAIHFIKCLNHFSDQWSVNDIPRSECPNNVVSSRIRNRFKGRTSKGNRIGKNVLNSTAMNGNRRRKTRHLLDDHRFGDALFFYR